ncbi:hypothetical protein MBLNU13_g02030t1 [Cladosporium sp. NU13]
MARLVNKLRAVFSLMCLDLPSMNETSETDDNNPRARKHTRTKSAKTHSYPKNSLMGLPTEPRLIIYKLVQQDVVDTIADDSIAGERRLERRLNSYMFALQNVTDPSVQGRLSPPSIPLRRSSIMPSQQPPRLGGLALPLTILALRKESLDVYGPLLKAHQQRFWDHYIGLQNAAKNDSLDGQESLLDAEVDAYLQWRAIGCLQSVTNCMYVNECYVRGYNEALHTEARMLEWLARV